MPRNMTSKGREAERTTAEYARRALGDPEVDRMVKHGTLDQGDVGPLRVRGHRGFAEVKYYAGDPKRCQLEAWKEETLREQANGGWDFGILVVHRQGCGMEMRGREVPKTFGDNYCYMTLDTLCKVSGATVRTTRPDVLSTWVMLPVRDAFGLMRG